MQATTAKGCEGYDGYQVELPTYEDAVGQRIPALAEKPLVEQDPFHRDVTPLLEAMR